MKLKEGGHQYPIFVLRPEPRLFLATCGCSFIAEQRTRCQTVHERNCSQYGKTDGDNEVSEQFQPFAGLEGRILDLVWLVLIWQILIPDQFYVSKFSVDIDSARHASDQHLDSNYRQNQPHDRVDDIQTVLTENGQQALTRKEKLVAPEPKRTFRV